MKDSTRQWIAYAEDNLACARIVAENGYFNPALQNAQQAVEKVLKALTIEKELEFRKTHSIQELRALVLAAGIDLDLADEDCELLDSIYLPSKYPLGSALPENLPDRATCDACIAVADRIVNWAKQFAE